jgi:putative hydrolase of the HAD superfamily
MTRSPCPATTRRRSADARARRRADRGGPFGAGPAGRQASCRRTTTRTATSATPQLAVRAVVFDLDDTLYPEREYVRSGYRAVAAHLRRRLARAEPFEDWLWQRFRQGHSAGAFDALEVAFHLGLTREKITELVGVYREHVPDIRPYDGVEALLRRLRGQAKLGLLSDGFLPAQRLKLDALGLEPLFDAVVLTEEMGRDRWKPSPAGFEAVRERLGAPHGRCAYVADNPAKDFLAPNRLGWRTIQLRWEGQVHADAAAPEGGRAHVVVSGLDRLEAALR